jgi:hypothetical protein
VIDIVERAVVVRVDQTGLAEIAGLPEARSENVKSARLTI